MYAFRAMLLAIFLMALFGVAWAKCLPHDYRSHECRYPQGDSWCVKFGQGKLYAYSNNCLEDPEAAPIPETEHSADNISIKDATPSITETLDKDTIKWIEFDNLDRASKHLIEISEDDSVTSLSFAYVRLQEITPVEKKDSLLIYNYNRNMCGNAGCDLKILTQSNGLMHEILNIVVPVDDESKDILYPTVSLGQNYTNGMRNLRFLNQVTWIYNGSKYNLK